MTHRRYLRLALAAGTCALVATTPVLAGTAWAAGRAGGAAAAPAAAGPQLRLVAAQNQLTVPRYGHSVYLDPGVWVTVLGTDLRLQVTRPDYQTAPSITQLIRQPGGGMVSRPLPASVLDGWNGLGDFVHLRVATRAGKLVAKQALTFCPDSYDPQRASPDGPQATPYPNQCSSYDPFPKGEVWGISRGWGVDPAESSAPLRLALGTYQVTVRVTDRYQRLFGIPARYASATVTATVVQGSGCCGIAAGPRRAAPRRAAPLAALPSAPTLSAPPMSARPDLVALPSWGITTSHVRSSGQDLLNFGATVWIGGNSPLDVQGFRSGGSPVMPAYQYFWRHGRVIGRVRAGTMGFDRRHGHDHWHFEQFAAYRLLNSTKKLAVASHKQGFCIAPTDGVDLALPGAVWQPPFLGFGGACGSPTALWVRETLPVGWGDTYFQSVAGQSFDITHLPNGTYYIEVIANPEHVLKETTLSNDISLRQVILGGKPGSRTVRVPAWHGIDPEG